MLVPLRIFIVLEIWSDERWDCVVLRSDNLWGIAQFLRVRWRHGGSVWIGMDADMSIDFKDFKCVRISIFVICEYFGNDMVVKLMHDLRGDMLISCNDMLSHSVWVIFLMRLYSCGGNRLVYDMVVDDVICGVT